MQRVVLSFFLLIALALPASAATYCWNPLSAGHAWTESVWTAGACSAVTPGAVGPPTAADIAQFSSTDTSGVTLSSASVALNVDFTQGTGYTGTVAGSSTLAVSGSFTLFASTIWTYTGAITFNAVATGKTFTTAGVTFINNITFNGTGGGWTLQDNLTTGVTNTIQLTAGILNTNAKTVNAGVLSVSGSTTRTATFTNSTFNLSASGVKAWDATTISNLTRTFTGSTINVSGASATFAGGSITTYSAVNLTGGGSITVSGTNTYVNFTINSTASIGDAVFFQNNMTATGTCTFHGSSQVHRIQIQSNSYGTNRTFTCAAVALTNVNFANITGAGAATWTGTSIGDCGGNSGITLTPAVTRFWVGNAGSYSDVSHWSATTGGSGGSTMPLPQDTATFDSNSFSSSAQTVVLDEDRYGILIFTGVTHNPIVNVAAATSMYNSITLDLNMTTTGHGSWLFRNQGLVATLTSAGAILTADVSLHCDTTSVFLGSDLVIVSDDGINGSLDVAGGTLDTKDFNVRVRNAFTSTGSPVRALTMGSSTFTFDTVNGTFWSTSGGSLTLTPGTSLIKVSANASPTGTRTFAGGGKTFNNFQWASETSNQGLALTGANTFATFQIDGSTTIRSVTFPAATITTATTFNLLGISCLPLTIQSSASGSAATLSQATGTVAGNFLTIKDSTATGGATFNAANSTNVSGNTGWNFTSAAPTCGNGTMLMRGVGGWLLKRDFNPANDNSPMWLEKAT